jgi:hypothetical protein
MSDLLINFNSLEKSNIVKPTHKKKKSIKNISSAKNENIIDSKAIINSLRLRFLNHKYQINNAFIYEWESDFFTVTESGYIYEIEIKVTRGDFKDDFNKTAKHTLLESIEPSTHLKKPNKFFYAAPKNLLATSMIPAYAGLIEVDSANSMATIVKEAPFLHREKGLENLKDILLDKFYHRYRDLLLKEYTYNNQ